MSSLPAILFWVGLFWATYAFLVYPTLMFCLSRLCPRRLRPDFNQPLPTIELITAARNEENTIRRKLRNYAHLDYPRHLLTWTIGSDASTDATDRVVREYSDADNSVRLVRFEQRRGKTGIVYSLAKESKSDILLFTDADIVLDTDALRIIARRFSDPTIGGVVGHMVYHDTDNGVGNKGEGLYNRLEAALRRWESHFWTTVGPTGQCFAVRRGSYRSPPSDGLSDDTYLAMSIPLTGKRVWYEPALRMHDDNSRTLRSEIRRRIRVGRQNAATFMVFRETRLPWRSLVGFQLWSHRILRNLAAIPILIIVATAPFLDSTLAHLATLAFGMWTAFVVVGAVLEITVKKPGPFGHPLFFTAMMASLMIGSARAWIQGGLARWESPRASK